ncbi:MAG: 50S ribosomal protein L23 [Candidatus Giovannonibacteria bacterium GW2011_GWB1_46_20]|uniref:Large ribosomal subunit protein uL23 n=3 Tax=Parcubacteria group TaxID=1794811 RepID=A0A0G1LJZ5_9BACT|nr:MAG: 50S ribosomal protein L23, large subunit ribosomal protein L23 [Parcubacteria group bacterium GW2011_GWC1_44_10]KKT60179.1 MAG: 50S ribosomal protein L23 [Candidatus Giovannonibacteria bacterium GW2011_GWA1_44_25]KKU30026.1 MAG: 50S ribosomal protein L23 [Candidatus Giovannonibacteria bacterium GW2011_GWB1_46_20]
MPFNLSQIFGGWRRKESRTRKALGSGRERGRGIPPSSPSLTKGGGEGVGFSASEQNKSVGARGGTKSQSELARRLLIAPHISEKATMLGEGRYVFKVTGGANKNSLKKAIEDRYGVGVEAVNIVAPREKQRRRGANLGIKSGFKKAVIKLKEGQTISEF